MRRKKETVINSKLEMEKKHALHGQVGTTDRISSQLWNHHLGT
jgi:hypothetical protein